MMKIESVQVIPSRKDSMFEETPLNTFDCTITTSYDEWKTAHDANIGLYTDTSSIEKVKKQPEFDELCERFAKTQKAYMVAPTALFHDTVYVARTVAMPTEDHLLAMSNTGPLYMVFKEYIDDIEAGKTEERFYVDPQTFAPMYGLWYPYKAQYRLRYGVREING